MAIKSAYREKPVEAPNIPEEPPQPSETTRVEFTNGADKAEHPPVAVVNVADYPEPDEATLALQKQLADLKKSEAMQREFAAQVAAQRAAQMAPAPTLPPGREERIALWRTHGLTDDDAAFLEANPELIDNPRLTRVASDEAEQQGYERGSDSHRQATLELFNQHLGHQQAQPAASVGPASTPTFFEPPAPSRSPATERPGPASYVSAPVSRREVGAPRGPTSPRQVKLSGLEQELAKNLGISDLEYAKQKLLMMAKKASGEIQS